MKQIKIKLDLEPSKKADDFIRDKLSEFNDKKTGVDEHYSVYAVDANNNIIGGVLVYTEISSIFIDTLWVDESKRDNKIGSKLLKAAEDEGIKRNIFYSTVDTYAFQAPEFYRKNGYKQIGVIKDYIEGHDRLFFRKNLNGKYCDL